MYHERGWLLRNPLLWIVIPILAVALTMGFLDPAYRWFMVIPSAFLALLLAANLNIDVDDKRLSLTYFPFWRRTIPLARHASAARARRIPSPRSRAT